MTTAHYAEAERHLRNQQATYASAHLLAAIHDGQAEQTALLRALVERAMPQGDPCPRGCRRNVEPEPHVWKRPQNVTSRVEVCDCGAAPVSYTHLRAHET